MNLNLVNLDFFLHLKPVTGDKVFNNSLCVCVFVCVSLCVPCVCVWASVFAAWVQMFHEVFFFTKTIDHLPNIRFLSLSVF